MSKITRTLFLGSALVAVAACNPLTTIRPWTSASARSAAGCDAFATVASAAAGTWLSGARCALFVPSDGAAPTRFALAGADVSLERLDDAVADGDDLWLLGTQRQAGREQTAVGRLRGGQVAVAPPAAWGLGDLRLTRLAAARPGEVWAAGAQPEAGRMALARYAGAGWAALDVSGLTGVALEDVDVSRDGCTWAVGRRAASGGVLVRYDGRTLRQENVDPARAGGGRVVGVSCGDVWIGRQSAVRYAHGHREEIAFGPDAEVTGMSLCPDGDLLLVGRRQVDGGPVGFSFRIRDGRAQSLDVQVPYLNEGWELRDVGCGPAGAWAVGQARRAGEIQPAGLVYRLDGAAWSYQAWTAG